MTRVVGIDLGSRRIGVAVSDGLGLTAQPRGMIGRHGGLRDLEAIAQVVREVGADRIVLGLPLDGDGTEKDAARRARQFGDRLASHLGLPVELIDESFSTVEAEDILIAADLSRKRRREVVDKVAAAIILQRWLDRQRTAAEQTP
ncbi:MAG TPA: Holliday junction resolvase RuvX [Polyangia bacterium]